MVVVAVVAGFLFVTLRETPEELLVRANKAMLNGEFARAEELTLRVLKSVPDSVEALQIAAQAASVQRRYDAAVEHYTRLFEVDRYPEATSLADCGKCQLELGRASDAEHSFRRALHVSPDNDVAQQSLLYLLQMEGRTWDARPLIVRSILQQKFISQFLVLMASIRNHVQDNVGFLDRCRSAAPDDPVPELRAARDAIEENEFVAAEEILGEIIAIRPDLTEAHAWLGVVLASLGANDKLVDWNQRLPSGADDHPLVWYARGEWALNDGQHEAAARCFLESMTLDPNNAATVSQLARSLSLLGRTDQVESLETRAHGLHQLRIAVDESRNGSAPALDRRITTELMELGRYVEAAAWFQLALRDSPDLPWANTGLRRALRQLAPYRNTTPPLVIPDPLSEFDPSRLPLPVWPATFTVEQPEVAATGSTSRFRFIDAANDAGLRFTFHSDASEDDATEYLFKYDGGGIGVVDFDGDHFPDFHLTQGTDWPRTSTDAAGPIDRFFQNLDGETFRDVTMAARLICTEFGQGVTVGDYDGDGFPDIYVANVTRNRFFRNLGDGTFEDVTAETGTGGNEWTSSCALADLNADGLPDLYTVSYLGGDAVNGCRVEPGRECTPTRFPAGQDQVYLNLGQGGFENVTGSAGAIVPDCPGLGIVVGDFDGRRCLDVFVANDMSGNTFFVNQSQPGGALAFSESALGTGLAYGGAGRAQAGMGIAAGDINADRQIDLFVTNFYREQNALYMSDGTGLYAFRTQQANLARSGFNMLGFGTQFLDADLDGDLDLVIANGHVFPFLDDATVTRMRPQFHENTAPGRFSEVASESVGPYFEDRHFGRALARVDWNRDGRDDLAVGHFDTPVALLTNHSHTGRSAVFRLIGTESARDAIGTTVTLTTRQGQQTRQLTAGDGYQCSNERKLVLGLGSLDGLTIENVHVRWPSGREQSWDGLDADTEYSLVEGQRPVALRSIQRDDRSLATDEQ